MTWREDNRDQALRQRAKRAGLRLRKQGPVYELCDFDAATVHLGSFDSATACVRERSPRRRGPAPGPILPVPPAWEPMIDGFLTTLAAAGQPATTIRNRRDALSHMARELGGDPAAVTGEHLVTWLGGHTEWALETRRQRRTIARRFFLWAYKTGRIPAHIADDLPTIRQPKASPRPTPDHAWQQAIRAADTRTTLILRLAAEAGLRRGEISRIHSRDLVEGIGGAQLLIHGKGGKPRVMPLSDALAALIRLGAAGHTPGASATGWLFPSDFGEHVTPYWIGQLACRALPDGWTLHTLRHRFATRAYRGSRNLRAVQVLLGHASIATTERYTALDDDEIRAAAMMASFAE